MTSTVQILFRYARAPFVRRSLLPALILLALGLTACDSPLTADLGLILGVVDDQTQTIDVTEIASGTWAVSGFDDDTVMLYQIADGVRLEAIGVIDDANETINVETWVLHVGSASLTFSALDDEGRPAEAIAVDPDTGDSARITFEWLSETRVQLLVFEPMDAEDAAYELEMDVDETLAERAVAARAATPPLPVRDELPQASSGTRLPDTQRRKLDIKLVVENQLDWPITTGYASVSLHNEDGFVARDGLEHQGDGMWTGAIYTTAPLTDAQLRYRCNYVITGTSVLAIIPTIASLCAIPEAAVAGAIAAFLGLPSFADAAWQRLTDMLGDGPEGLCDVIVNRCGTDPDMEWVLWETYVAPNRILSQVQGSTFTTAYFQQHRVLTVNEYLVFHDPTLDFITEDDEGDDEFIVEMD